VQVNYLAVGLAALSAFFLGFLWYTVIFAKPWQALIGMGKAGKGAKSASQTPDLGRLLIGSLILEIIMAYSLAMFIGIEATWQFGLFAGFMTGLTFVGLAFGVNYMFEGKPFKLWAINAAYNTVVFSVMGLIIGAM
jgi:hypothetical protein